MKRRAFLTMLGATAACCGLRSAVRAQQPAMPVIGFLGAGSPATHAEWLRAFRRGLAEAGYLEGQSIAIEHRWAEAQFEQLKKLARELAQRRVAAIMAGGDLAALAAKAATATIPIVFTGGNDPIGIGLVDSLNRPGGNLTGITLLNVELGAKRLQILHELLPAARSLAVLHTPAAPSFAVQSKDLLGAAGALGISIEFVSAGTAEQIDLAFESLERQRAGGLLIGSTAFFNTRNEQFAALSARYGIPAIFQNREFVVQGGLVSYGSSIADAYRICGGYIARILKGEKPAELPVQQVTKVELIINQKTARVLGLTVPLSLLARADEVIE